MADLPPKYDPASVEERLYKQWESHGLFRATPDPSQQPYTIVIPPPNVTGILHMGHALNNTIQDILIRYKRMQGFNTLWVPGTDHAGIATQNVVERALAKEGKRRQDLGREAFVKRVWQWKDQYGNTIIRQLKRLGASCDWTRTRFTMDEGLSEAVLEVFVRLYEQGLIYRGKYIINWCPRCQTALADEEAPRKETHGKLWHIRYPIVADTIPKTKSKTPLTEIIVATTRPETMLGDTAVAVHPKDKRYKALIGAQILLPIANRKLPIIADEAVDREFGTGAVKVTPAHDPADFQLGKAHNLEFINIMSDDAHMTHVPMAYEGLDRFECRKKLLGDLEREGFLVKVEDHLHNVGHCYRCDTVVEPRLSLQWFVKMKPLAKPAIAAVKKKQIVFTPARWTKVYLNWMENIQDWCISRQIWWGHRLPVYYCEACGEEKSVIVSKTRPEICPRCRSTRLRQDEDVLDTWFSSWLWPFSTLGWPKPTPDLQYFYPTDTLVTAPEIIFFWVARMIMAGYVCMGKLPFRQVYIHGTVRDLTGKKMSKSLGNIIDPLDIIQQFGTDALRYTLVTSTAIGTDVFISEEKFIVGRNFANKLWNATRYLLATDAQAITRPLPPAKDLASEDDQWILSRLQHTIDAVTRELDHFRFHEAASAIYEFVWHDVCDWYLELSKIIAVTVAAVLLEEMGVPTKTAEDARFRQQAEQTRTVLAHVLSTSLRLLHPFMPFITEELWTHLRPANASPSVMIAPWPTVDKTYFNYEAEKAFEQFQQVVTGIRMTRIELNIPVNEQLKLSIVAASVDTQKLFKDRLAKLRFLAGIDEIRFLNERKPVMEAARICVDSNIDIYLHYSGLLNVAKVRERLAKQAETLAAQLHGVVTRLANQEFTSKAPAEIVEGEKTKQTQLQTTLERLKNHLAALS